MDDSVHATVPEVRLAPALDRPLNPVSRMLTGTQAVRDHTTPRFREKHAS